MKYLILIGATLYVARWWYKPKIKRAEKEGFDDGYRLGYRECKRLHDWQDYAMEEISKNVEVWKS